MGDWFWVIVMFGAFALVLGALLGDIFDNWRR